MVKAIEVQHSDSITPAEATANYGQTTATADLEVLLNMPEIYIADVLISQFLRLPTTPKMPRSRLTTRQTRSYSGQSTDVSWLACSEHTFVNLWTRVRLAFRLSWVSKKMPISTDSSSRK